MNEEEAEKNKSIRQNKYLIGTKVYYCNADFEICSGRVTEITNDYGSMSFCRHRYRIGGFRDCYAESELFSSEEILRAKMANVCKNNEKHEHDEITAKYAKIIEKLMA